MLLSDDLALLSNIFNSLIHVPITYLQFYWVRKSMNENGSSMMNIIFHLCVKYHISSLVKI